LSFSLRSWFFDLGFIVGESVSTSLWWLVLVKALKFLCGGGGYERLQLVSVLVLWHILMKSSVSKDVSKYLPLFRRGIHLQGCFPIG
jgi:hypothetical protein